MDAHDVALLVLALISLIFTFVGLCRQVPAMCRCIGKMLQCPKRRQRDGSVLKMMCKQKITLVDNFNWYVLLWSSGWLIWISLNKLYGSGRLLMTARGHWAVLLLHTMTLISSQFPRVLHYRHSLDVGYIAYQSFVALILSDLSVGAGGATTWVANALSFVMISFPASSFAKHVTIVLICQTGLCVLNTAMALWTPAIENPIWLIMFSFFVIPVALLGSHLANTLLERTAESKIRESDAKIELDAASSLLELTCDAVIELDQNLKLLQDSPKLATMLLRRPGTSQGTRFTDFIATTEAERAAEILLQECQDGAHAFHTRLVDSCGSKFRTEVFQVKFSKTNGEPCHLLGLRDFTDLNSLAGNKATDAIRDLSQMGPQIESLAGWPRSASQSSSASDQTSNPMLPHPDDGSLPGDQF